MIIMKIINDLKLHKNNSSMSKGKTIEERFWEKVDKKGDDDCWEWLAAKDTYGYGHILYNGNIIQAHRISCMIHKIEIPENMCVLHTCDNPGCVNYKHFEFGTRKDNSIDRDNKNRQASGENNGNSKLNWSMVKEIRRKHDVDGMIQQQLANEYNVNRRDIGMIINNEIWIDNNYIPIHRDKGVYISGENNPNSSSDWEKIRDIREEHIKYKTPQNTLAKKYKVSKGMIYYILKNINWYDPEYQKYLDSK